MADDNVDAAFERVFGDPDFGKPGWRKPEEPPPSDGQPVARAVRDIPLIRFNDIKLGKQRRCLVKNLFPRVGLSVVWGPPKCGKSFWTFDVVMHVAIAREYRGRRVHP